MSVQVKKRFEEMAAHLGRDTIGLAKLKSLKDDVNILRTKLAAAEERAAASDAILANVMSRASTAETALSDARREIQTLSQREAGLRNKLDTMLKPEIETEETDDAIEPFAERDVKSALKRLRKHSSHCPELTRVHALRNIDTVDRDAIAAGWSNDSMYAIGVTVSLLAMINGSIAITSSQLLADMPIPNREESGLLRHIIQWYAHSNVDMYNDNRVGKAGIVRLTNMNDAGSCYPGDYKKAAEVKTHRETGCPEKVSG